MKIAFRIDISSEIGTGHYYRMSALADAFSELNHKCVFFKSEDEPIDYSAFDIIILDTYEVTDEYINSLSMSGEFLVCYDDNALYTYNCDVLLNANLHAHELNFRFGSKKPQLLLGGKYALLRREFREAFPVIVREYADNIFVCFGGSDLQNITPKIVRTLKEIDGIHLNVVLGAYTKNDEELFALSDLSVSILKTPVSVSDVMKSCDVAVTAAGSMVYELASIGLPGLTIIQAENQRLIADYLDQNSILKCVGDWKTLDYDKLKNEVNSLLLNCNKRRCIAKKMLELVDKKGALNAAEEILVAYASKSYNC